MIGNRQNLEAWARQLRRAHGSTVQAFIALGRQLLEARADVGHGSFLTLFKGQRNAIPNAVPISLRAAEYYMLIAKKLEPYSQHVAILPNALRTLLVLCQLQPITLQAAIEQHRVHAAMTEKEAKGLLAKSPPPKAKWSLDSVEQDLLAVINRAIEEAPGSQPLLAGLLRGLAEKFEDSDRPELHDAVSIARDEMDVHDAEPGGFRIFDGSTVIASCKSNYPRWFKDLTTAQEGVTPLTRKQVEARLDDIVKGKLPTKRTGQTHSAVLWAIKDLLRTSPLSRGVRCATTI
jgi:hypothetical protein